jgi:hypothetical protein
MALGTNVVIGRQPWIPSVFGKAINFVPGDPTVQVELQRATDSSGTGATTIASGLLFPKPGAPFVDQRANDGSSWFYRARHNSPGGDAGAWTAWVGGVVAAIPEDVLAAAINYGGASVYPLIRAQPWDDTFFPLRATLPDGSTAKSDAHNPQGSVLPMPVDFQFSYQANADTSWGAIAWSWPAGKIYRPDGTTITVPASSTLPVPANPTLSQVAGGSLGARNYWVRTAYVKTIGVDTVIYSVSGETQNFAVSANNLLKVTAPAAVAGYDGWCVLVGTSANNEFTQGARPAKLTFGVDWTEPTTGAKVTDQNQSTPFSTTWVGAIVLCSLGFSNAYRFFVYWDLAFAAVQPQGIGVIMNRTIPTSGSTAPLDAQAQQADGHIPLALTAPGGTAVAGYIVGTSAAASNTGSGSNLGGRF